MISSERVFQNFRQFSVSDNVVTLTRKNSYVNVPKVLFKVLPKISPKIDNQWLSN